MDRTPQSDLVYDVGAHHGEDSDFYLKAGYRVVAVEANPALAAELRLRFADAIAQGRYTLVERAVGPREGTLTFYVNDLVSDWGTADPAWAERNRRHGAPSRSLTVPCVPFAAILERHGCPHYLKVDVEGADMLCIAALEQTGARPALLSIESSSASWTALRAEFRALEALGYTRFKVIDQSRHTSGTYAARDGSRFTHTFPEGASGPFGADLPGSWLTAAQAIQRYRRIFVGYALIGSHPRLMRALARLPLVRRLLRYATWYDTHALHEGAAG
ncbi:FkbM family methyltransferase [Novosphingobium sp. KCTC 2891]|uniref:FkbM family methyltransferase n=1 Tax=Novosphingobium sp. KCTC 2891 TaxID=2989730 RepID=UPI00222359E3|nr:FkbM family methyltransferase [Novosphingobium sp. KCTC 2891]MCW1383148.1 FkbM family methyltransferase [Novosphingobium sp. KCTC 2891]